MPQKVLVLDDCETFAEELQKSLSIRNYRVFQCSNSDVAIDLALIEKPNIFVCDWQLDRGNNGLIIREILKCICPELKVLFISAFSCHDLRENLNNQQNLYFLEKPFYKSRLLEAVTMIESQKYVKDKNILPVALYEINTKIIATNTYANEIAHDIEIEGIKDDTWNEFRIKNQNYFAYKRSIPNCSTQRLIVIEKKHEMIIKDPRYDYFLTGKKPQESQNNSHMLVIDQHQAIRTLASEIMHENMVFCHTAVSIDEGMEILKKDKLIKTIVVDSAFEQQIIRRLINTVREKHSNIKIVGTFASSIPNVCDLKFDDVLLKPFSAQKLVRSFFS